ncbi:serine protease 1-like [Haliotis asinina]|uniref:serine protease 1-like n=1 Tax=Haliotis asinina TaxID=109174 RepID=UPI0035320612
MIYPRTPRAAFFVFIPAILIVLCCGEDDAPRVERAIGGRPVTRGSTPWLVLLRATIVTTRFLGIPLQHRHIFCGGSVLNDRWVITAAHCFKEYGSTGRSPRNWEVRLATTKLRTSSAERLLHLLGRLLQRSEWMQWEIGVERIVIHPHYNESSIWANDIAMVRLSRPVPSGPEFGYIKRVNLPRAFDDSFPGVGQLCVTTGWGCTSNGGGPSPVAREIQLPVYSDYMCELHYSIRDMDKRVCAGYRNGGVGVCSGDSGSPLVCREDGKDVIAGVVSFTSRDRPGEFPAVFTRVTDYVTWIRSVIGES